jgi:hypothetical protein
MPVAYDAFTASDEGTTNRSWSHVPVGVPKGIIVFVGQITGGTDEVTSVTYGGVSMSELAGSPINKATSEVLGIYAYFLGSGIPVGTQTVLVTVSGSSPKIAGAISVTASAGAATETIAIDATINSSSVSNPSVTLNLLSRTCFCCIGFGSGQNAPSGITPLTDWTDRLENDYGLQTGGIYTYNIIGSTNVTAGWTQGADDAVMIAVAISEISITPVSWRGINTFSQPPPHNRIVSV